MPERLIGAVLKTVVRSRVPWVRIPPPPYFSPERDFFSMWDEYSFSPQMILRLKRLFLPQSAVCKGFDGRKFPTKNHLASPESPYFEPTSPKHSLTCPNSVQERVLGFLGTSGAFFT